MNVIDVLAKYSHDSDKEVAINACMALGLVGAGTCNSRIANLLRGLANFYYKDAILLSAVKLSQVIQPPLKVPYASLIFRFLGHFACCKGNCFN